MAEDMGIPLLGEVPIDTRVRAGGDEGRPIVAAAPDAPAAKAFSDVAGKVAAQISIQNDARAAGHPDGLSASPRASWSCPDANSCLE